MLKKKWSNDREKRIIVNILSRCCIHIDYRHVSCVSVVTVCMYSKTDATCT